MKDNSHAEGRRSHGSRGALVCTAVAALLTCAVAGAQSLPDAGALQRQIEQQQEKPLPAKSAPQFTPPAPLESLGGATVTVKSFRFAGNTLLTSEELAPAVAGFTDRPLDFAGLQNAARAVATAYRQAGWVVRVYLPEQDVTGGTVTIQIVEAKFGSVRVDGDARRVPADRLRGTVESAQSPGAPVSAAALDRALLLIDDLPGVSATGRLSEGRNQAETDLVVTAVDGAPVTSDFYFDNAGARHTGEARVIAAVNLNSPLRFGDRADFLLLHSQGSDYARAAYSVPVGSHGWRAGLNASYLNYDIVTSEFSALDAQGDSTTLGIEASYPLLRSRLKNLYFAFNAEDKRFDNESGGTTTTDYSVQSASLGLHGNLFDSLGGGGANTASIAVVHGRVDLSGSPNEAADALTTDTAGSFQKLTLSAARQQFVTERLSLYASLSGQIASQNLDSSEKLYLGGSTGVRAYPANEGAGSEGLLLNLEARARLPANFNLTGFFDWGSVRVNKDNDFPGRATPNSVDLKGAGMSLAWTADFGLSLKATLARRIGSNPNATITGDDQDGSLVKNRFWLQASLPL